MGKEEKNEAVRRALEALRTVCRKDPTEEESSIRQGADPDEGDQIDLWQMFTSWFDAQIKLDAAAVARRDPNPRWCTTLTALYADLRRWTLDQNLSPPDRAQFRRLLSILGCDVRLIAGEEFIAHLALRSDVDANEWFQTAQPPAPVERREDRDTKEAEMNTTLELFPSAVDRGEPAMTIHDQIYFTSQGGVNHD